jgi:hypothetical protein
MLEQVKNSFSSGVGKIKWFAELFNARLKAELAVFRLMAEAEKMKKEKAELARAIGEKAFEEFAASGSLAAFGKGAEIADIIKRMEILAGEINEIAEKASRVSRP